MEAVPHIQTSLALYQYLCQHVAGTEQTVKTRRLLNTIRDSVLSDQCLTEITSGSFGEGLEMKGSDVDVMYVLKDVNVYEFTQVVNCNSDEISFVMDQEDTQPGFTQLRLVTKKYRYYRQMCKQMKSDLYLSNELFKSYFSDNNSYVIHGPCFSDEKGAYDFAICLHSRSWITPVNNWITRPNLSWPNRKVKSTIIDHGVLFVAIGTKGSVNEEIEWRISFSVGEKLLIYTFCHTQLLCYALMKILLKDVIGQDTRCKDLLCSYYLKTIMFWISEELPLSVWKPENIIPCFLRCFRRLVYCVEYAICPHYFIPENNMFENKIKGNELQFLLETLRSLYTYGWQCILFSEQFLNFKNLPRQMNDDSQTFLADVEQIMNSIVLYFHRSTRDYQKAVNMICHCPLTNVKYFLLYYVSISSRQRAQSISVNYIHRNKDQYRQHKKSMVFLLQNLHHDAVSGWLMLASYFYKIKQYHKALAILSYSLSKCTPDKIYHQFKFKLSDVQCNLLKLKTLRNIGLMGVFKVLRLAQVRFIINSSLIPEELELEVHDSSHKIPPAVFANFLRFLCYYQLNSIQQCRISLMELKLTISEHYFISGNVDKSQSYICLGVALQLVGEHEAARRAFIKAVELNTEENSALKRLQIMSAI